MNAFWTDEKIELLRKLYLAGRSASQSAVALGTTRNAVVGKWHRLNFSGRAKPALSDRPSIARRTPSLAIVPPARARVEPEPPVIVQTTAPDDGRAPCSIVSLAEDGCKWGVDFQDGQHLFCNKPRQVGKSYCPEHVLASI